MTAKYHPHVHQGSEEWLAARCGLLTASEMKLIVTPTLKIASNDKERAHLYELMAQRISKYVEPHYISDDMLRGIEDEIKARAMYADHFAPVEDGGFVTNDKWGFTIGYSPDGLVGAEGLIEAKSRRQKFQVQTMIENVLTGTIPADYVMQHQTGLLVADDREWIDFISYSGGFPMVVVRVWPDTEVQSAIIEAAEAFEHRLAAKMADYHAGLAALPKLIPTERTVEMEMYV
ncbi:YqaJ viral recombinase family protein [Sphingomonas sp.]|uniref:YqaJ viral recombinase family protein n=1 Tax=Sphingomonas sp. TaxID=28214 RepID=UPI003B3B9931